jgi:SAM-dependent methyltransferase
MESATPQWAMKWQLSWDRLEEKYIPDREAKLNALIDVVEATAGGTCTVLDLACGTGSVTLRLLRRLPAARVIALDVDPVLLTIASATFASDDRVQVVRADLRTNRWFEALAGQRVDAVLTATALHWLSEDVVRRLYRDLSGLIRPGGVFAHLEKMPLVELPHLGYGLAQLARLQRPEEHESDWDAWWEAVAQDPLLASSVADRHSIFEDNYPTEEFSPPADWHIERLREAGFPEAGVVWRAGSAAVAAAVR